MNDDWTETMENMTHDELVTFATLTMGMLSATNNWIHTSPQELFDHIMSLSGHWASYSPG